MNTQKLKGDMNATKPQNEKGNQMKVETQMKFTPKRFSVRGLRKHTGVKTSRTPRIAY